MNLFNLILIDFTYVINKIYFKLIIKDKVFMSAPDFNPSQPLFNVPNHHQSLPDSKLPSPTSSPSPLTLSSEHSSSDSEPSSLAEHQISVLSLGEQRERGSTPSGSSSDHLLSGELNVDGISSGDVTDFPISEDSFNPYVERLFSRFSVDFDNDEGFVVGVEVDSVFMGLADPLPEEQSSAAAASTVAVNIPPPPSAVPKVPMKTISCLCALMATVARRRQFLVKLSQANIQKIDPQTHEITYDKVGFEKIIPGLKDNPRMWNLILSELNYTTSTLKELIDETKNIISLNRMKTSPQNRSNLDDVLFQLTEINTDALLPAINSTCIDKFITLYSGSDPLGFQKPAFSEMLAVLQAVKTKSAGFHRDVIAESNRLNNESQELEEMTNSFVSRFSADSAKLQGKASNDVTSASKDVKQGAFVSGIASVSLLGSAAGIVSGAVTLPVSGPVLAVLGTAAVASRLWSWWNVGSGVVELRALKKGVQEIDKAQSLMILTHAEVAFSRSIDAVRENNAIVSNQPELSRMVSPLLTNPHFGDANDLDEESQQIWNVAKKESIAARKLLGKTYQKYKKALTDPSCGRVQKTKHAFDEALRVSNGKIIKLMWLDSKNYPDKMSQHPVVLLLIKVGFDQLDHQAQEKCLLSVGSMLQDFHEAVNLTAKQLNRPKEFEAELSQRLLGVFLTSVQSHYNLDNGISIINQFFQDYKRSGLRFTVNDPDGLRLVVGGVDDHNSLGAEVQFLRESVFKASNFESSQVIDLENEDVRIALDNIGTQAALENVVNQASRLRSVISDGPEDAASAQRWNDALQVFATQKSLTSMTLAVANVFLGAFQRPDYSFNFHDGVANEVAPSVRPSIQVKINRDSSRKIESVDIKVESFLNAVLVSTDDRSELFSIQDVHHALLEFRFSFDVFDQPQITHVTVNVSVPETGDQRAVAQHRSNIRRDLCLGLTAAFDVDQLPQGITDQKQNDELVFLLLQRDEALRKVDQAYLKHQRVLPSDESQAKIALDDSIHHLNVSLVGLHLAFGLLAASGWPSALIPSDFDEKQAKEFGVALQGRDQVLSRIVNLSWQASRYSSEAKRDDYEVVNPGDYYSLQNALKASLLKVLSMLPTSEANPIASHLVVSILSALNFAQLGSEAKQEVIREVVKMIPLFFKATSDVNSQLISQKDSSLKQLSGTLVKDIDSYSAEGYTCQFEHDVNRGWGFVVNDIQGKVRLDKVIHPGNRENLGNLELQAGYLRGVVENGTEDAEGIRKWNAALQSVITQTTGNAVGLAMKTLLLEALGDTNVLLIGDSMVNVSLGESSKEFVVHLDINRSIHDTKKIESIVVSFNLAMNVILQIKESKAEIEVSDSENDDASAASEVQVDETAEVPAAATVIAIPEACKGSVKFTLSFDPEWNLLISRDSFNLNPTLISDIQ